MKKITLLLLAFLSITLVGRAAVTVPVDYTKFFAASAINANGNDLETGNATAVNTWFLVGTANGSSPAVSQNNLSYLTYIDNSASKKITLSSGISAVRTSFFNFTSSATDLATGSYYLSFLMKVTAAPAAYVLLSNYTNSTNANNARGRVQIKDNGTSTGYKLQPLAYNAGGVATPDITYNATHLIVIKYQIITPSSPAGTANGSASLTIFVDPTPGSSEPAATYTSTQSSVTNFDCLKSLVINQQPGLGAEISGLRFSTSWADVCKAGTAPKLTTPTASAANPVSSTGFTANWTPVSNALSYDVKVYQNGTLVSTTNASGQSASSLAISGLSSFLTYTYTVIAKGDGTNYSDSDPSASQSFTTTDPNAVSTINTNFNDGSWGTAVSSFSSGSYPSSTINNFILNKAGLTSGNRYGSKGESHVNSISMDNVSNNGYFTMPTVNSIAQMEIHAATGTAERTFTVKEFNTTTSAWDLVGTYTYNTASKNTGLDSAYVISISRSIPSKFRIENAGAGSMSVMQVITRSAATSLLSTPTVNNVSNIIGGGFTANWNTVADASGYRIIVTGTGPSGLTSKVRYAYSVTGQSTNSCNVTGTDSISNARVRVAAIGDGDVNFSDSYLSLASSSFNVLKSQTITFASLASKHYGDAPVTLSATGGASGSPVVFSSSDSNVATCTGTNGTTLTIVAPGTCTIYANQAAGGIYAAAPQASRSLVVNQGTPSISVSGTQAFVYSGSAQGPATINYNGDGSTSLLYTSTDGGGYSSATAPAAAGAYQVVASAGAGTNYAAASSSAYTFTIYPKTSTFTKSGVSNWSTASEWTYAPLAATDLVISSGELVVDQAATVHSITVAPGARLTLNSGQTLAAGTITLQSDATHGTATLLDNGATLTATATVEQYLTGGRNWYISSPVTTALSNVINSSAGNVLWSYSEPAYNWTSITATDTPLSAGIGYVANLVSDGIISFNGTLNTGNQQISITRTENGKDKRGFNLIANPYPSYLDPTSVINAAPEMENTVWYRTKVNSTYSFETVNTTSGVGTNNSGAGAVTKYIPPMQAFWVRMAAGYTAKTLTFANNMRSHEAGTNRLRVKEQNIRQIVRLQVSNGTSSDETVFYTDASASNSFDAYDSQKMTNNIASLPEIYSLAGTEQLAINGLNAIPYDTEMPLGFTSGQAGTNFSIKASQFSNLEPGTQILLHDYVLNTTQDLAVADYSFSADAVSTDSRFTLTFRAPSVTTGVNTESVGNGWISTGNGQLMINGASVGATLELFNAVGQEVLSVKLTEATTHVKNNLVAGVYVVKVSKEGKTLTKKLIID